MVLRFLREKVVEVEPLADGELAVTWKLADDLLEAEIQMKVLPPDLEITEAQARIIRAPHAACASVPDLIEKVEGVRIGPGLRKIVKGLIDGPDGCSTLTAGVLECCNAVILHFTRPGIQAGDGLVLTEEEQIARGRENLKRNPRLVRSCIAFADDSPIMQGLGL
ncbi:MAG: DUF2889 domain-containing protein [Deltaproteobacteria bacterium]|nr:DUF2889 domain-containing protein [Deltaproteobacteria bacterium]MBW2085904.1 DUF2889 domain-containing protein [Deltaproteobacteria bacterium]